MNAKRDGIALDKSKADVGSTCGNLHTQSRVRSAGWHRTLTSVLFLWCAVLGAIPLLAQDSDRTETMGAVQNPLPEPAAELFEPSLIQDPERTAAETEKRKKAAILVSAIAGIAILGVGGIAILMIWARHLRRLARDMGPPQRTEGNDFWFLKPPKSPVSEVNVSETHRSTEPTPNEKKPE